jgi:predicted RNA-binding Zn-ribbon protein involved in translation (DUF1610 family)
MIARLIDKALKRLRLGALEATDFGWDLRVRDYRLVFFNEWTQTCDEIAKALEKKEDEPTFQPKIVQVQPRAVKWRQCLVCNVRFQVDERNSLKCPRCGLQNKRPRVSVRRGPYPK